MSPSREEDRGLTSLVSRLADGLTKLVSQHLTLAKLELAEDAKTIGREAGMIAAFVPFILIGYALLCVALSLLLGRWLGAAGGFAVVGAVHLIAGAIGAFTAIRRLQSRKVLDETVTELSRSAEALNAARTELRALERIDAR